MRALHFSSQAGIMHSLLLEETWDAFPLAKAEIRSSFSLTLDGHLICDFYTAEEWEKLKAAGYRCLPYGRLRKICLETISGKRAPGYFKFVFLAPPALVSQLLDQAGNGMRSEDVDALAMNLTYRDGSLRLTTGTSCRIFSMDKSLDQVWDHWVCEFLSKNHLDWSELV